MDIKFMDRAIELAKLGIGKVNPNPLVGAVIVKNDKIIGEGYHQYYGGAHAEVNAFTNCCEDTKGAEIYVTLEPCSHYGKTPPCAKKIVEMGIKKCYVASLDPNPLVAGKGVKILEDAGIEVVVGIREKEAKELNRVFLKYITTKLPFIFVKCAITLDGKIATKTNNSKWITNELAREKVQKIRNKYSGIMVGINTILADNPSLNCRIEKGRNPVRIVIDPNLKIPIDAKIFDFEDNKNIIITSKDSLTKDKIDFLEKKAKIVYLEGTHFKMKDIIKEIGALGVDSILVEGGSQIISQCFQENIVDGGEIFIAPKILGDNGSIPFIHGFDVKNISDGIELNNVKINQYGNNVSFEFYN